MPELKLARLPDRTPVKISFLANPALNQRLGAYADAYKQAYGQDEKISELIPYMLEQFLDGDRQFRSQGRPRVRRKSAGG